MHALAMHGPTSLGACDKASSLLVCGRAAAAQAAAAGLSAAAALQVQAVQGLGRCSLQLLDLYRTQWRLYRRLQPLALDEEQQFFLASWHWWVLAVQCQVLSSAYKRLPNHEIGIGGKTKCCKVNGALIIGLTGRYILYEGLGMCKSTHPSSL